LSHYCNRPNVWLQGFSLPCHTWSLLNHFQTGVEYVHRWALVISDVCEERMWTTADRDNMCLSTEFERRLQSLHSVNSDTVSWL